MIRDVNNVWIRFYCVHQEAKDDCSFHLVADFKHHQEGFGLTKEMAAPTLSTSNGYLNIEGGNTGLFK